MATLELPPLNFNTSGWGPAEDNLPEAFKKLPYQPFSKKDPVGKVADWTGNGENKRYYNYQKQWQSSMSANTNIFSNEDPELEDKGKGNFSLVNNELVPKRPHFTKGFNRFDRNGGKHQQTQEYQNNRQNNTIGKRRPIFNRGRFGNRGRWNHNRQVTREASIKVETEWKEVDHLQLINLAKKTMKQPEGEDVAKVGLARAYNKKFDSTSVKTKKKCEHEVIEKMDFTLPITMKDKKFRELTGNAEKLGLCGNKHVIIGTDNCISTLMCSARSVIPWDLTVHKRGKFIIIDNDREEGDYDPIDTITVSETANDQIPPEESVDEINKQPKLIKEATMINNTMSQMMLRHDEKARVFKGKEPAKYELEDGCQNPNRLYRYRKFTIDKDGDTNLLVRTTVDAYEPCPPAQMKRKGIPNFVNIHCLNEWNPKYCSGISWSKYLEKQSAMILATELKNNNFKVAKWIMNAKMGDITAIKLAYIQRDNIRDNENHNMVNMESYAPETLAQTANLNIENCWYVFKNMMDSIIKERDGTFHIVKAPMKQDVFIYRETSADTSDEEESSGDESGSDSEEDSDSESGSGSGSDSESEDEEEEK